MHGRAASATSDVFLLGSVVYLAVEGHGPFDSPGDPAELVRLVGSGTTRETERARGLVGVLSRLHVLDPAARPSAAEAATLLGSVSARAAATVVAEPPPPTAPGPTRADAPTLVPAPEPAPQGVAPPGPRRWVRRGTAAVTATLLLLTGAAIAAAVVLRPSQGATTAPERLAIGDARLADPCALVRPGSLARFGEARTVTDFSSYESCSIDLREPAASSPTVRVVSRFLDPAGDPDPTRTAPAPRPEITRPPAAANGACRRGLTLPDRYDVEFSAVVIESTTTGLDLCAVADAALTDALLTLLGHGVPLRATAPAGGLAELDACALVGPAAGEVPDLAGLPTDPGFGGWSCVVGRGGAAGPSASIRFSRSFAGNDSPTAVVGGRPAAVTPGTGRCALRMVGRSYTGAEGDDLVELVLLDVEGTTDPCATATALATAMAPAVPA